MQKNHILLALALGVITTGVSSAAGAPEDFDIGVMPAVTNVWGTAGSEEVTLALTLTTRVDGVSGWSFGALLELDAGVTAAITSVQFTDDTGTVNGGAPAGFNNTSWYPASDLTAGTAVPATGADGIEAGAVTQGIVIDFGAQNTLAATTDFAMLEVTVAVEATAPMAGEDLICARLVYAHEVVGSPATATIVVHEGASVEPAVQGMGEICFFVPHPHPCDHHRAPFTIDISDAHGGRGNLVENTVTLNFDADGTNTGSPISGWSFGVCILDPTVAKCVEAVIDGTDTATLRGDLGPGFNNISVFDNGATQGVVVDMASVVTVPAQNDWTNLVLKCEMLSDVEGAFTDVAACSDTLGTPPVANVMVIDGASIGASIFEGGQDDVIRCSDGGLIDDDAFNMGAYNRPGRLSSYGLPYVAGDANSDGRIDIADGIRLLGYLWRGGAAPACLAAGDFNGDGAVDTTDAIALIYWQLQPEIEGAPFPGPIGNGECMEHDTELECEVSGC